MSEKGGIPPQCPPQYPPQEGYAPPPGGPPGYDSVPQQQYPSQGYPGYGDHPQFQPQVPPGHTQILVAPGPITMSEPPPPDYMNRAIFTTICCFWPVGIFAIMKASEAKNAYARGDLAGARSNSNSARQLTTIAIFAGVASLVVSMIIVGVYVGLIMTNIRNY